MARTAAARCAGLASAEEAVSATVTIFVCHDIEEGWHQSMAALYEAEWEEHEREMCIEDADSLYLREPVFFEMRAEVDPYWPPRELDPFEEVEPEVAP